MTPTPTRPEPTTPTREEVEASANAALDECAALTDGDIKVMARWIKQHLTSDVPVTRDVLVKHFKSRIQPPFAAPETLTQESFLERFEARAQKKAEDDADAILALIGAKQP